MSKIKQFFRQSGLTKAQLLASALCYFLCFALFLGIVVIWNPLSLSSTPTEDSQAADGPTNTGYWTDTGRYDISWYNNPDTDTYGDGTAENPYKISTAEDLAGLSWLVYTKGQADNPLVSGTDYSGNYIFQGKFFEQTANIDLSAYYWQPIGIYYTREGTRRQNYFSGSYDGGNHTVSGIFTPAGSSIEYIYQGLFGYVYSSSSSNPVTIQNLGIIDSFIQGGQQVGGVVGYAYSTTITNCYNTGTITGSGGNVGGVVGYASSSSTITNCYNTGTVSGYSDVGGVVGRAYDATITNCYNTGAVNGSGDIVGGVVGYADASSSSTTTITNCYNTGSVTGAGEKVGGVVGDAYTYSSTTTITNCYNTGSVSGSGDDVGGVVGYASSYSGTITITNCYNTGSVSGSSNVGGVVGRASPSPSSSSSSSSGTITITNCYNTGSVSGSSYVGGVVGHAYAESSDSITITNCYNTGAVSGSSQVGGVVGGTFFSSSSSGTITITNCYNTGSVTSTATSSSYVGGVVGRNSSTTITNCYYGENCSSDVGGINGADEPGQAEYDPDLAANAKDLLWYTTESNWDPASPWKFDEIWTLDAGRNDGYPSFIIDYWISAPSYYSIEWFNNPDKETYGDGSESNPYIIDSAADLAGLSWLVYTRGDAENTYLTAGEDYISEQISADGEYLTIDHVFYGKHFKLTADIDLSAHYWQPIGIQSDRQNNQKPNLFSGNFNGDGHTISGLYTPPADYLFSYQAYYAQGLFGAVSSYDANNQTSLENLNIQNASIQGCGCVGALVGGVYTFSGDILISNISSSAIVDGSGQHVGGIVGYIDSSFGSSKVELLNCESVGLVRGTINVGGIVGDAGDISGSLIISKCFNSAQVICADYFAGGIIGKIGYFTGSVTISDSYNTAEVEVTDTNGSDSQVGGIVGSVYNNEESSSANVSIRNCYNTGAITGSKSRVGGIIGEVSNIKTTITNCYNTGSVTSTATSNYSYVGGVVGNAGSNTTITNCYNTGTVSGYSDVGGVVGNAGSNTTITSCYYGGGVTETPGSYGTYLSDITTLAKDSSWYEDSSNWDSNHLWDFAFTWKLESDVNDGYPILDPTDWWINEGNYSIEWYNNSDTDTYGDGSASNPYIIDSAEDLAGLSWLVYNNDVNSGDVVTTGSANYIFQDKYFKQTADIDLSAHVWQPIGIQYTRGGTYKENYFSGNYDGDGYTVSYISTPAGSDDRFSYQGLFGHVSGNNQSEGVSVTIQNVGVINSHIQGCFYVGGVVGSTNYNYNVTITGCYNTGSVTGTGNYVGGVVGYASGTITNCYNTGDVTCLSNYGTAGGVVGIGNILTDCYNTGNVNASGGAGGLAGSASSVISRSYNAGNIIVRVNPEHSSSISVGGISSSCYSAINCYNTGSITVTLNDNSGSCQVAGITASIDGKTVSNCYNLGNITVSRGPNVTVGGIALENSTNQSAEVLNCFNLGTISANASSAKIYPITDVSLSNCYYSGNSGTDNNGATYLADLANKAQQQSWCEDTLSWDFIFTWKTTSLQNKGYPIFKTAEDPIDWWLAEGNYDTSWFNNSNPSLYGNGAKENPYKIKDAKDLAGLSYIIYYPEKFGLESGGVYIDPYNTYLNGLYFVQTADIDLSAHIWQPIGVAYDRFTNEEVNRAFAGNYDGQGYTISGIKTLSGALDSYEFQGLFGLATGYNGDDGIPVNTVLQNINIHNSTIGGNSGVGSIAGLAYGADVKNCQSSAVIKFHSETSGGIGGVVGGSGMGLVSNCSFFGKISIEGITSTGEEYVAGIVGTVAMSTIEKCNNFASIVSNSPGLAVCGIVGMAMMATITDCNNYGTLSAAAGVGGIAYILAYQTTVTNCGMFGSVILTSDGGKFVGFADTTQNAQISNSVVDCKVQVEGSNATIFAFVGKGMSESGTFINLCSSNVNVVGSGTVVSAGVDSANSSLDAIATNSYFSISGQNISAKGITAVNDSMEGNFVYLDGFKNGLPVPIKTDGTNFFHMHDFGSTTGIVEKVNDALNPNLITEQFEIDSVYMDPNSSLEAPVLIEPEIDYLPYELDLVAGKEYVITFYVEGKKIVYKTTAAEIKEGTGKAGLTIGASGGPIYIDSSGNFIVGYIMSGYRMNLIDGTVMDMDYSGKTYIMFGVSNSNNGQPLTEPKQVQLVSIRELAATNLLDEPIVIQTNQPSQPSDRPENLSPVDFQVAFDHNFNLLEGATYRVTYEFTPNGGETLNGEFTAQAVENSESGSDGSTQRFLFLSNNSNENDWQLGQYMCMIGIMENVKYEGVFNSDGTLSSDYYVVQTPGKSAIVALVATQDLASFIVGTFKITGITLIG